MLQDKKKAPDTMEIQLPYLPNAFITIDDMLGKIPKMRCADHDVRNAAKFLELAKENYLINIGEIRPLGRLVLELAQWIT